MKKIFAFIAVFMIALVLSVTPASAATASGISATGTPVTLTALVPEYIGFSHPAVTQIRFGSVDDGGFNAERLALGASDTSVWVHAGFLPSWTLTYNLAAKPTITVCAYATDFLGDETSMPASVITGTSLRYGAAHHFTDSACSQTNAFILDKIPGATFSAGAGVVEGFGEMGLQLPTHMTPGTYTGTLNIIAQTI